ncbi:IS256 family transposase [Dehalogenimonas sp. THU2]|uniref:IS256 family transposase n=1 Tax=Dehalogenimonas sp. THU2 TaxID=3151121 RepID=UPI003218D11E
MAKDRMTLLELARKSGSDSELDFLKEGVKMLAEAVMELEVKQKTGAEKHERNDGRLTYRNGYRGRSWDTRAGTIPLEIPRLRDGSYFPSLLEPRRRAEQSLLAVIQEAYVLGISTRKVESLVQSLGLNGISKSEVSRICAALDDEVERWRNRPLFWRYPYLWLDATYVKVRDMGRVVSQAVIIAYGVRETGEREIIGLEVGPSEDSVFWKEFLRRLVSRGLDGVMLVISDAHLGLKEAISTVFTGVSWQRCRVHFMRNALARVPRGAQAMVSAAIRTIFAQPDRDSACIQLRRVADNLKLRFGPVADQLEEAEPDILAYTAFPREHWRQLYSTNPLERLNKEIKRRSNVVGIFPNSKSVIRLIGAVLMEQQDEWEIGRRYFSLDSMKKTLEGAQEEPLLMALQT